MKLAMIRVSSSAMTHVGHDEKSVLHITFPSGETHEYRGVSSSLFHRFMKAKSMGQFFQANIRDRYTSRKVEVE